MHLISISAREVHTYVPKIMPGKVFECIQYGDCVSNTGIDPALVHCYNRHTHTYQNTTNVQSVPIWYCWVYALALKESRLRNGR